MPKYVDNDKREEKLIKKVEKGSGYSKGQAIAALKSKGVLKQAKGKPGLMVKKKGKK